MRDTQTPDTAPAPSLLVRDTWTYLVVVSWVDEEADCNFVITVIGVIFKFSVETNPLIFLSPPR